jgi:hypothetical protein
MLLSCANASALGPVHGMYNSIACSVCFADKNCCCVSALLLPGVLQRMQEEIQGQEQQADRIGQDAVVLHDKLRSVNREGFKRI